MTSKQVVCQLHYLSFVAYPERLASGLIELSLYEISDLCVPFVARYLTAANSSDAQLAFLQANVWEKAGRKRRESLAGILG
jgi:hypothetical protein